MVRVTGGAFSRCECNHSPLCINVIASSIDRSRCSPGPPCTTRRRTANAPNAANTPPMYSPRSPPIEIGGPAGSPRKPVRPDHACRVNSLAARSAYGSGPTEVGDGHDDRSRKLREQSLRIDAPFGCLRPRRRHHDDVGARQLRVEIGTRPGQAVLTGIEIAEQRRISAVGDGRPACAEAPKPIPLRRLDFPDLGTGVDQELSAVATRDAVADLDNTDVLQRCRSAASPVAQPVSVYARLDGIYAILVNLPLPARSHSSACLTSAAIMPLLLRLQYMEFAGAAAVAPFGRSAAGIR